MKLNPINALMTKMTFQTTLLKSAYTVQEIHAMVALTDFKTCEIQTNAIGMEIALTK